MLNHCQGNSSFISCFWYHWHGWGQDPASSLIWTQSLSEPRGRREIPPSSLSSTGNLVTLDWEEGQEWQTCGCELNPGSIPSSINNNSPPPLFNLKALITHTVCMCLYVSKSLQLYSTLCDPVDCSLPGSSVRGILQARILQWVAIPFSRGSFQPGIEPRSPALQADSLSSEPPGQSTVLPINLSSSPRPSFFLQLYSLLFMGEVLVFLPWEFHGWRSLVDYSP